MKKILGLDLGTNSIGAALINMPESIGDFGEEGDIEWIGSRIIPMDGYVSTKTGKAFKENPFDSFSKGIGISKAASRRIKRGSRRLKQRYKLRRTRLIQAFKILSESLNDEKLKIVQNFPENFKNKMNCEENFSFKVSDYLPFEKSTIEEATKILGKENKKNELVLPEDWIIYYLRKKATIEKISIAELFRITYMMNQRRGFKSSRKDLKETLVIDYEDFIKRKNLIDKGQLPEYKKSKGEELETKFVAIVKILSVEQEDVEKDKKGNYTFRITSDDNRLESWIEKKKEKPEWVNKGPFTLVVTQKIDNNGKFTQNKPQIPKEDDWSLCVTAQDNQIGDEYPGTYFFNGLVNSVKNKTDFKIRQYAVYRKKYKKELEDIWHKQIELNENLKKINIDKKVLRKLAEKFYPTQTLANKPKLNEILSNDLLHLISDDIIYYQRDLKSQKNSRGECQYESHNGKEIDGVRESYGVKCAPKSSPEFQEMRIWQDIHNIKILQRNAIVDGYAKVDIDVTEYFIDENIKEKLFEFFDSKKEISQQNIFDEINKHKPGAKLNDDYRINMFFDGKTELKGNETKEYFRRIFKKETYEAAGEIILNDKEKFYKLWNISYSISLNDEEKSKEAIFKALTKTENKKGKVRQIIFDLPDNVAKTIASASDIETSKKYASYSSKAIHKLLPVIRCGKYYDDSKITGAVRKRAKEITIRLEDINHNPKKIHEIADDDVQKQLLKSFIGKKDLLKGLNTYQACYLVYDRHSERINKRKYVQPSDFNIMEMLPNNSLRNPVVEQVIREALFVVKDVWEKYGQPDEIHIEMGRDLKKNAKQREKATKTSTKHYEEKQQIRKLLSELLNDEFEQYENIDDDITESEIVKVRFEVKPNPDNPRDIDRFKLWQEASGSDKTKFNELFKSANKAKVPTKIEIKKYALWLSQKCVSPYSGKIIPLSKLFDGNQYDFEHILPKSKLKNDSLDNLIICEKGINKAKGGELAAIFINAKKGKCKHGNTEYKLFSYDDYVAHCKKTFRGRKLNNLLADSIPEDFISRQINDTRYITKTISELLFPVTKDKDAGIVFTIGAITSDLKREWGLQKEWKKLIKPRFERLEKINKATYILQNEKDKNDIDFHIPENPDLDTKRIDHRHHALDAIIIAATTREHIRHLNNLSRADSEDEYRKIQNAIIDPVRKGIRDFALPWKTFTKEVKEKLEQTIVTFKSYNKVIDKPKNFYSKWVSNKGKWEKKEDVKQVANPKWMAVRKSLFAEQPHGKVLIKEIVEWDLQTPKQLLSIYKLQIEREKAQNTPAQSSASFIYDKETREIVKQKLESVKKILQDKEQLMEYFKLLLNYPAKKEDKITVDEHLKKLNTHYESFKKEIESLKIVTEKAELITSARIAEFHPYAAKRKEINKDFDHKIIDKIPYADKENSKIPNALHNHLLEHEQKKLGIEKLTWRNQRLEQLNNEVKYDAVVLNEEKKKLIKEAQSEAFSDEGLEKLEEKIGMKIRMVTLKEDVGIKIELKNKYSEADGNPYFVMYENIKTKARNDFKNESLSSYHFIQKKKNGLPIADEKEGYKAIILQTNDLVYVPTKEDFEKIRNGISEKDAINWDDKKLISKRLYIVNDFSKSDIYFKPNTFSKAINSKELHTSFDDKCSRLIIFPQKDNDGNAITEDALMIKEVCIKIYVDRLGNISPVR